MTEKVEMSEDRRKSIRAHIKVIMRFQEKQIAEAIDKRKAFSDFVIDRVVRNFVHDLDNTKCEMDEKCRLSHELYLQYMQVWEEMYGENGTERKSSVSQNAV